MITDTCKVKHLRNQAYETTWADMKAFTDARTDTTPDELWVVEHPPIFTLGQAGKMSHLRQETDIPVLHVDRGGQITYHGPGQIVVYCLINLKRKGVGVRQLVTTLENSVIDLLKGYGISAKAKPDAPGIYVDGDKICSIGLRIRRGCSFHGLALNVDMDLSPFDAINTCGYPDLSVTQVSNHCSISGVKQVSDDLVSHLKRHLGYTADQK